MVMLDSASTDAQKVVFDATLRQTVKNEYSRQPILLHVTNGNKKSMIIFFLQYH